MSGDEMTVDRDVDAAMETASASRVAASEARQGGFSEVSRYHTENAKAAERWAVKRAAGKA